MTTTRDLLAEIETREHTAPRPVELERSERGFVRWTLLTLAVVIAALYVILWWLDPISVTGRQTRFSIVENGGVRQAKLDLMEELPAPPDVLLLGSSRAMKLDPAVIESTTGGASTAFNGAVSGGTIRDMYLYARYADELWGGQEGAFPHLVLGVAHDVLRNEGTTSLDPRLKQFLPRAEKEQGQLDVAEALLQTTTVEAATRAVNRVLRRDGPSALLDPLQPPGTVNASLAVEGRQKGNQRAGLTPRGMQAYDPEVDTATPLPQRVEAHMREFVTNTYDNDPDFTGADPRAVELLRETIELANRNGDAPTLWVTPYQPDAVRFLPAAFEQRDAAFRAVVRELDADPALHFTFLDLADLEAFGGTRLDFYDGIHMTESNTARVIAELDRRTQLRRGDTRLPTD